MSKAEDILFFDAILAILLFTYGISTGTASIAQFNVLKAPTLAPLPLAINCNPVDFICNGGKDIAQATAYIGWAVVNLPVLIIFFTGIIFTFFNVVLAISFSPAFNANGVPYLGLVFSALQLYVIWEVFRGIRGVAAGV